MPRFAPHPLALTLIALAAVQTHAQQTNASDTPKDVETLMVWGTQVKASSLAMDAEAMEIRQPDHIGDLLRIIPGVDVGGAHSLNQRITIRSMDDKDLRISIDGANQNTYMYHHMGNLQIHADILESAEIDVGNNSVIHGGLGGSVRFKTKDARTLLEDGSQFGGRIRAGYADNAGSNYALTGYGQVTDTVDVLAYFNHVNRDNYEVGGGKILGADGNVIAGTDGNVRGLEGEVEDALIKFGWDFAPGHRVKLGYESYADEGDYSYRPDMGLATDMAIANSLNIPLTYPTKFTRDTTTLNYVGELSASTQLEASVYQNQSTFWRDEQGMAAWVPEYATINQGDADNVGINLIVRTQVSAHQFTYGADVIQYETSYRVDGRDESGEKADHTAVFIEDRISTDSGISVIPGIRYETADVTSTLVDNTFSEFTGALAGEYQANDNLLFRVSATQLFRAPELAEVFIGAGLYDAPNSAIEAETGINQQISAAYQTQALGADNLTFGVTFFQTDIDDYIYDYALNPTTAAPNDYWKDNVGNMRIKGYEAYIGYDVNGLRALLTFSDAESELDAFADYAVFDRARIDRQQGDTVSFSLDYTVTPINLSLHWDTLWVDDVAAGPDLDGATLENSKDGFVVSNISAHWESEFGLGITLGVDNLFDKFYASQSSRTGTSMHPRFGTLYLMDYEPGRNAKITVGYKF